MGYITCWSCGKETEESDFFGNKNKNCIWCNKPLKKQPKSKKTIDKQEEGKAKDVVQYHNNGKLKRQGTLDAYGKPHGNVKEWYSNGNISKDQNFKNGIHHGECKAYFENGNIWQEYNFKNGKQHGINNEFYEDGSKNITCVFKDGKEHGMREQYYPSGELENRANYIDGLMEGVYLYLSEDGEAIEEKIMQEGMDVTLEVMGLMTENNSYHMYKAIPFKDGKQKIKTGELSEKIYKYYKKLVKTDLNLKVYPVAETTKQLLQNYKSFKEKSETKSEGEANSTTEMNSKTSAVITKILIFSIPILCMIGFIIKGTNNGRIKQEILMEKFNNRNNATLYFEDCSSIIINKEFIKIITDFNKKYEGNGVNYNYMFKPKSKPFNYNGDVIYLTLNRRKPFSNRNTIYDNISVYKNNEKYEHICSSFSPVMKGWYESFANDNFSQSVDCE